MRVLSAAVEHPRTDVSCHSYPHTVDVSCCEAAGGSVAFDRRERHCGQRNEIPNASAVLAVALCDVGGLWLAGFCFENKGGFLRCCCSFGLGGLESAGGFCIPFGFFSGTLRRRS